MANKGKNRPPLKSPTPVQTSGKLTHPRGTSLLQWCERFAPLPVARRWAAIQCVSNHGGAQLSERREQLWCEWLNLHAGVSKHAYPYTTTHDTFYRVNRVSLVSQPTSLAPCCNHSLFFDREKLAANLSCFSNFCSARYACKESYCSSNSSENLQKYIMTKR